jgi:hypothetical protein
MAKVSEVAAATRAQPVIICDYTPPRGGDPSLLDGAKDLAAADFIAVAYNPGKLVRADSAAAALALKQRQGTDVIFNLSPRDMNKLALQSRLLGAQLLGLENVLVLQGDPLTGRDGTQAVSEYTASGLIGAIAALNQGSDLKGSNLRAPADFCIGASADLNRGVRAEAELTARKVAAGAAYLVTQPIFAASKARLPRGLRGSRRRPALDSCLLGPPAAACRRHPVQQRPAARPRRPGERPRRNRHRCRDLCRVRRRGHRLHLPRRADHERRRPRLRGRREAPS